MGSGLKSKSTSGQILRRYIEANRHFFAKREKINSGKTILVIAAYTEMFAVVSTMKISAAVAEILGARLCVLPHFKCNDITHSLIGSFLPSNILPIRLMLLRALVCNGWKVWRTMVRINKGVDVLTINENHIPIGMHMYDSLLRRANASSIELLDWKQRINVAFDLVYFYAIKDFFKRNIVDFVVLPDNTYRDGMIYELMKKMRIPCIVGIDLNGISMHKNETAEDYEMHCRVPDKAIVESNLISKSFQLDVTDYATKRFSGKEQQHDTMRAFDQNKVNVTRLSLREKFDLSDKKIVLVMAHIFCDAPHALPNLLFRDFEEWLISTCVSLSKNQEVEFLVKEHPSANLYKEDGKVASILEMIGLRQKLLDTNVNTNSLFDCVDVLVTCGGTGGMEFPCFGVPVLVAARPSYSQFSYVTCPRSRSDYLRELGKLQNYQKLNDATIQIAKSVMYVINVLMKVPKSKIGLGSQEYYLGSNLDLDLFFEEMGIDCETAEGYEMLLKHVGALLNGPHKNLYAYSGTSEVARISEIVG